MVASLRRLSHSKQHARRTLEAGREAARHLCGEHPGKCPDHLQQPLVAGFPRRLHVCTVQAFLPRSQAPRQTTQCTQPAGRCRGVRSQRRPRGRPTATAAAGRRACSHPKAVDVQLVLVPFPVVQDVLHRTRLVAARPSFPTLSAGGWRRVCQKGRGCGSTFDCPRHASKGR